ncbi:myopalladin isoform X2 [Betta splendens]|uniref:Myopalladin n=1 Tax=Betta splendens TaxID=158456 RepID=A0A9W2X974_BETSP|nr:myopalladin isoform X2 [Betta splendens]
MQENSTEQPPSLSQLLRESYLAQQRHSEMSRSDASSTRLQIYGSLKGKADSSAGHSDPQLPDLSAFLSQEELDKSVNLARQAIGHEAHEERAEVRAPVTPLTPSNVSAAPVSSPAAPSVPLAKPSPAPLVAPSTVSFIQPAAEFKEQPAAKHPTFTSDRQMHKASSRQDNMIRNSRDPAEGFNDLSRPARNAPYGLETQSKKEFLNKAADFIEELSSLFKANSAKRVRPRACKAHRSRAQSKNQSDGTVCPLTSDSRERTVVALEVEKEEGLRPAAVSHQPEVKLDSGIGHVELQDCRASEEQQYDSVVQEAEAQGCASIETPYAAEAPACEPPHFIQKLKSREVPEGSKVQLDCIVRGQPVPEVRWFCEGKELENSPDIQILSNGELHSLIITEAFEEDTGRYSCFASNFYGTDSISAEIYVEGASSSDSEGEQNFEPTAQLQKPSAPSSSLSTEDPLPSQPESAAEEPAEEPPSPPSVQRLLAPRASKIPTLSPAHAAQETQPPSPAQAAPAQAPQPEIQTPTRDCLPGLKEPPGMSAPVFTKSLQELVASEGQLVVLECRVKGEPSPRVDWHRDGRLIQDSPEFRILQKKEICTLVIAEVFAEDSGMFTCTASNTHGTVSSSAELKVKGDGSNNSHVRPFSVTVLSNQVQEASPSGPAVNHQPEATVMNNKPHSSGIRLDPLASSSIRLDPLSTSILRVDPSSSSMSRPDPLSTTSPNPEPTRLSWTSSSLNSHSGSIPSLDPLYLNQNTRGPSGACVEPPSSRQAPAFSRAFAAPCAAETARDEPGPRVTPPDASPKVKGTSGHQNGSFVVPLPDPPPNSCLKTGSQANRRGSRSRARVGRRVHFKLPEEEEVEQSDGSSPSDEDAALASASRGPPPVLAKPKLDPAQLQLLHNQVLMEQQQETEPQTPAHVPPQTPAPFHIQPAVPSFHEAPLWSPRMPREPHPPPPHLYQNTASVHSAPPLTSALSAPAINTTFPAPATTSPAPSFSSPPPIPQLKTSSLTPSPLPAPHLHTAPPLSVAPAAQMTTIHASHLNLLPAALFRTPPPFCSPPAPKLSTVSTNSTPALQQITSPTPLLRSTHASLMNLTATSHGFSYTRPKEFIAAQTFSPVMSPSPVESPVPLLQELAAELNSSAASSPTLPPFPPPPRTFPTRVLTSPTSPPSLVTSPTPGSAPFPGSVFALRAQSPPQASSPTSSSSTPSPILNPVAFLSSVLPSLTPSQPTNSMGLPKRAPLGPQKKTPKLRLPSAENIRDSKELVLHEIETKLRFKDDTTHFAYQQKLRNEGKTVSRPLGPNIPATVINYHEEYKVSNFEQRLMSEIEFRLERTPVEESDDEVQHDDVPTGKCIAPVFDKKLRSFRATEGGPVTFSCKIVGIPIPKVYWFKDGKQILKKNLRYKKIREGDGTCALHIESTTSDDDGNYTVMAANPQGRLSCSGHLIVQTGPSRNRMTPVQPQRVRSRIQEVEGEQTHEHVFRPHFVQAPGDLLAHEGRLCRLDCKVSGLPSPELMWLVNGRPIYPDLTHKMLVQENSIHSLVIDPLTQSDGGTYTCIASNKAEREMKHPPQFVEKLQNMGIPEGSPVRLECRVLAVPPPRIFWKKDNDPLDKSKDRFSMTQDPTGYVCLLIQPTTKDDAGWYTVSARNEAGVMACTCRLDIYAQWHQSIPEQMKRAPRAGSRYAALTGQGLDIKAAFATSDTSPILFSSSPPEAMLESEEL